jgi:DNA-binding PadR family transcriptional regulator
MKKFVVFADLNQMSPSQLMEFGQLTSLLDKLEAEGAVKVRTTIGPSRKDDRPTALIRRGEAVVRELCQHPDGMSRQEMCAALDMPDGSLSPTLTYLIKDGQVRTTARRGRGGGGRYFCIPTPLSVVG